MNMRFKISILKGMLELKQEPQGETRYDQECPSQNISLKVSLVKKAASRSAQ
jgi:hypothetical protein